MFGKKNSETNLRRRFHLSLLSKRKEGLEGRIPTQRLKHQPHRISSAGAIVLRKLLYFIVITGTAVGLFYVTFFSSFFDITGINLEKDGNAVADSSLSPFLEKLRSKNLIFVQTDGLTRELEQTFKNEILLVEIKKSYPHKLTVKVTEYPAVVNLRVDIADKTQKLVVNQIGYAIDENNEQKNLPILTVTNDKPFINHTVVMDRDRLIAITDTYRKFTEMFGMKITQGAWRKTERELHLTTEKNFTLWIDLTGNIDQQLSKLKRALPKLDIYHESLDYVDLRIAGADSEKVIFKRRQ